MAILASTTYAFAPATSLLLQKQTISTIAASSSLNAFSDNNIKGGEEEISFVSAVASGWQPERGSFAGITRRSTKTSTTALGMSDDYYDAYAVIPDGGLSPCVIKVVGVGGGGCNAVSFIKVDLISSLFSDIVLLILFPSFKTIYIVHDIQTNNQITTLNTRNNIQKRLTACSTPASPE